MPVLDVAPLNIIVLLCGARMVISILPICENGVGRIRPLYKWLLTDLLRIVANRIGTWTLKVLVSVGLNFTTNTKAHNIRIAGWENTAFNYDLTIKQWDILAVDDTTPLYQLVPFKTKEGEICFLNLVDLTLHHNVYTDQFTESYVEQDGVTPWTPLNQTH